MGFNTFNPSNDEISNISEDSSSESFNSLKIEIESQIIDKELQSEALKEVEELKQKVIENKDTVKIETRVVLDDLRNELFEDLNALNSLDDKFKDKIGYGTFKRIFLSENVSDEKREWIYDLVESGLFEKHIDRKLKGEMFPDLESLDSFLSKSKKLGKIEKSNKGDDSDILELKELNIDTLVMGELKYYKEKINGLLELSSSSDTNKLKSKQTDINSQITKLKGIKILEEKKGLDGLNQKVEDKNQKVEDKNQKVEDKNQKVENYKEVKDTETLLKENKSDIFKILANTFYKDFSSKTNNDTPELKLLLSSLDDDVLSSNDVNEILKLNDKLIADLLQGNNLQKLLNEATNKESYNKIISFVTKISSNSGNGELLLQKLETIKKPNFSNVKSFKSVIYNKQEDLLVGDSSDIMIDSSEIPPTGYIFNENGFKLETEIPKLNTKEILGYRRELQGIKFDIAKIEKEINKSHPILVELKNKENPSNEDKEKIRELHIEISKLIEKRTKLIERAVIIKEKIEGYTLPSDYKEELDDKQEKQREVLSFINKIGFDLLPQDVTDKLITEYLANIYTIPGLSLNKDTIDLKNGRFGENGIEEGADKWKENLIIFMDKAIYGEIGTEDSIFTGKSFIGEFGASIDPIEVNNVLEQKGLKTRMGWNINLMRGNLRKETIK